MIQFVKWAEEGIFNSGNLTSVSRILGIKLIHIESYDKPNIVQHMLVEKI